MPLKDSLNSLIKSVDGSLAAIIMAYDGISIDEVIVKWPALDMQLLFVEYAAILRAVKHAVDVIKMGDLEEVSVSTTGVCVIVRVLNDDLFAALVLNRDGNTGKGRHLLALKSVEILRELT